MKNKPMLKTRLAVAVASASLLGTMPLVAGAFELSFDNPDLTGRLDTTLSVGALWRVEEGAADLLANEEVLVMAAKGYSAQLNKNDANNNFDTGLASLVGKITPELDLRFGMDNGIFLRGTAFYDQVIMDRGHDGGLLDVDVPVVPQDIIGPGGIYKRYANDSVYANNGVGDKFTSQAERFAGERVRLLDAYVWMNAELADRPLTVQLGRQVINWGEALFIQNGINTANYLDLAALRLPGAEIKEALLPLGSLYFSYGLTLNLSMEGFYQFEWKNSEDAPAGTYYSTHDAFPGKGANNLLIDGRLVAASVTQSLANPGFTQIGDAFAGYTEAVYASLSDPSGYEYEATQVTIDRLSDEEADGGGQFGLGFRYFADALNGTEFGFYYTRTHARLPVVAAQLNDTSLAPGVADPALIPQIIDNARYMMVYPEDVDMFGVSFSTNVGPVALSGEVAFRPENPIINEVGDNLLSGLVGLAVPMGLAGTAPTTGALTNHCVRDSLGGDCLAADTVMQQSQPYYFYDEAETINASLVSIYSLPPALGADGYIAVLELGLEHVGGLDKRGTDGELLRHNATGAISAGEAAILHSSDKYRSYMTEFSWGYKAVLRATYNDIFAGVGFQPSVVFSHDVEGNSPIGGNFMEDRRATTLALNFNYLNNLDITVQGTAFQGAGYSNKLRDRDNASLAIKYAF